MPPHPIRLAPITDDLRRSRLTVFFRVLLAVPHLVWLQLWSMLALLAAVVSGIATLITGTPPRALHRFISAFVRYQTQVNAYLHLVANPFPGFVGAAGYPVQLVVDPPARQSRWVSLFRLLLALPALLLAAALGYVLYVIAIFGWFAALVTGRMPNGLRDLGAYGVRYTAQSNGYLMFLTDRYPYSGPPA